MRVRTEDTSTTVLSARGDWKSRSRARIVDEARIQ